MIPIELKIKGLYSYQKEQIIDFTKLTSAGLFGIFGPVGSGKSSILEAIIYAIYGKTDKLNQSGDNRHYNMMNLKSDELLIDLIFEAGKEQNSYRSIVTGRRNSKRFDDVKALVRKAYKKEGDDWIPIENERLEEAVGLSYENFKRTIIIPQGQFQDFLQLGDADRTRMMKELFNLDKFELYYKVASLESKNNIQKENITGQLQQLGTLDFENIETYNKQLLDLESIIKNLNIELEKKQKDEEHFRNIKNLIQKKGTVQKELDYLLLKELEFEELEKNIAMYEQCVINFKHLIDYLKENKGKVTVRTNQIISDKENLQKDNDKIAEIKKALGEISPLFENREKLKQKAEELNNLLKIKEVQTHINKEQSSLEIGNKFCVDAAKYVEKLKSDREKIEATISKIKEEIPNFTLLTNIKSWFNEKNNLVSQISKTYTEIEKYSKREKDLNTAKEEIIADPIFKDLDISTLSFNDCYQHLEEAISTIKTKLNELYEQESHILVKLKLEAFAEDLKDNAPCPLCGSLHHPELFKSHNIKELYNKIKDDKLSLEKQIEHLSSLSKQLSIIEVSYTDTIKNYTDFQMTKNSLDIQLSDHQRLFIWNKYKTEEELNHAFSQLEEIQEKIKFSESELQKKNDELKKEEQRLVSAKEKLDKIKNSLTIHQTEYNTLVKNLQLINLDNYINTESQLIEEEKGILLKEYERLATDYTKLNTNLQDLNKERNILKGRLDANILELEKEQNSINKLEEQLNAKLQNSNYSSIEMVEDILSKSIDIKSEKKRIQLYRDSVVECKSSIDRYVKEIGDNVYDSDVHKNVIKEIGELKDQIELKNKDHGRIAELLKSLENNIESQKALQKKMEALELRAENLKTMKSLFIGSRFVNYISSVYLQNLCNAANDRFFQLTRQKLSLEITEDNNFRVRDFMNGGKVRSIKTLSGGQTFQASLSLALALADNIQKITESNQNFFFLDEGFGSLDKESLNIVFDSLKSLRKENRIVGIISHVEEMQQEIESHLYIENHEEQGSVIHRSWANNY